MKKLKIDTFKKYKHYGEKIKYLDMHPKDPLLLAAQYDGKVTVFNYEQQKVEKVLEVSKEPLRTAIWADEYQIIATGDDKKIRIYSYLTTKKIMEFDGHQDFIRRVLYTS